MKSFFSLSYLNIFPFFLQMEKSDKYEFYLYCGHFGVQLLNLIFSLVSLPERGSATARAETNLKIYPENDVCLLSKLWFWWISELIFTGYKRELNAGDMWQMEDKESSEFISNRLEASWDARNCEYYKKLARNAKNEKYSSKREKINYGSIQEKTITYTENELKAVSRPSLTWALVHCFHGKFIGGSLLRLVNDLMNFVGPIILSNLISFLMDKDQNVSVGIFFAILLFLNFTMQSFLLQHTQHRNFVVGARLRTSLMNIIFKKVLY